MADNAGSDTRHMSDMGVDGSGMSGRDTAYPGAGTDHVLKAQAAQTEGMSLAEEDPREGPEDHGHVDMDHIAVGPPMVPHETEEVQRTMEDAD